MASIQRIGFSAKTNQFANIFKALGHPARLTIIETLIREKRIMYKNLASSVPLSETSVNRHARVLYEQGVIGYEKFFNQTYYVLNPIAIEVINLYINKMQNENDVNEINYTNVYFHLHPEV